MGKNEFPYEIVVRNNKGMRGEDVLRKNFHCAKEVDDYLFSREDFFVDVIQSQIVGGTHDQGHNTYALYCHINTQYAINSLGLLEWFNNRRDVLPLAFTWGSAFWPEKVFETIMPEEVMLPYKVIEDAKRGAQDGRYASYTDGVWGRPCFVRADIAPVKVRYEECYSNFQYAKSIVEVDGRVFVVFCKCGDIHNLCHGLPVCNVEEARLDWDWDTHKEKYSIYKDTRSYEVVSRDEVANYIYRVAIADRVEGIEDVKPEYSGKLIDVIAERNQEVKDYVKAEMEKYGPFSDDHRWRH